MSNPELLEDKDEMRPEYGPEIFAGAVRGKYYAKYQGGTNVVLLAPDVRAVFPDTEAVNAALRFLIKMTQENPLTGRETSEPQTTK